VTAAARELSPLEPRVIYHGPDQAAQETAALVAAHTSASTKEVDALVELSLGLWQGLLSADVAERQPRVFREWRENPQRVSPPDGETLAEASERAEALVQRLRRRHRRDAVVLVAPPLLGAVLRVVLGAGELKELWQAPVLGGHWDVYET